MKNGLIFSAILLCVQPIALLAVDWLPIDPAELEQKKPKVDPAADAEMPQKRMMIFKASLLHHSDSIRLTEKSRRSPVVMDSDALQETVRITLPEGFKVDELPPPVNVKSIFGKFAATWKVEGGVLLFTRTIEIPAQTVPAAKYTELREFLDSIGGSAELPVVLLK